MSQIINLLGDKTEYYLNHVCRTIDKSLIHIPSPDTVDRTWIPSDRNVRTLCSLQTLPATAGWPARATCLSCRSIRTSNTRPARPLRTRSISIRKTSSNWQSKGLQRRSLDVRQPGAVARKYAHKIPFIVKLNHNELLTYPNTYDQVLFGSVDEAWNMGAVAVGATIYFGSEQSRRQLVEISEAFERAHELGMATILWCYLRNGSFKKTAPITTRRPT